MRITAPLGPPPPLHCKLDCHLQVRIGLSPLEVISDVYMLNSTVDDGGTITSETYINQSWQDSDHTNASTFECSSMPVNLFLIPIVSFITILTIFLAATLKTFLPASLKFLRAPLHLRPRHCFLFSDYQLWSSSKVSLSWHEDSQLPAICVCKNNNNNKMTKQTCECSLNSSIRLAKQPCKVRKIRKKKCNQWTKTRILSDCHWL